MNPLTELTAGPHYLTRGLNLIRKRQLRPYVIIPLLINIVLIVALIALLGWQLHVWLDVLVAWMTGSLGWLPGWLSWLPEVLATILWWIGFVFAILVFCYFFTFLAILVASPFNGLLSSRVELLLIGEEPDTGMSMMGEMADAVFGTIRMLVFSLSRMCLLGIVTLILMFIPVINVIIPALWFIFGAFILAFEYLDAPMGNRGMKFADKLEHVRSRRMRHIGFGSIVTLATLIPIVNLIIVPAAVAGATCLYLDTTGHKTGQGAGPKLDHDSGQSSGRVPGLNTERDRLTHR